MQAGELACLPETEDIDIEPTIGLPSSSGARGCPTGCSQEPEEGGIPVLIFQ